MSDANVVEDRQDTTHDVPDETSLAASFGGPRDVSPESAQPPWRVAAEPGPPDATIDLLPQAEVRLDEPEGSAQDQPVDNSPEDGRDVQPDSGPPVEPATPAFTPRNRPRRLVPAAFAVAMVALSGVGAYFWFGAGPASAARATIAVGTFVLSSQPPGAQVMVDGALAGTTPLALQLTAGPHAVVVSGTNGVSGQLTAEVASGGSASHHLMLEPPAPPPAVAPAATLQPSGRASGLALAAGVPSAAEAAPSWVTFSLPFDVQIYEGRAFLGSSSGERLRVKPGTHTFTLVNETLGFRVEETVVTSPGRSTQRVIEHRSAPLNVNALPWAEVFIAGRSFGETPLANIALPIGTHPVTLRHPTLGERVVPVTVRLGSPNRLAVDLRR